MGVGGRDREGVVQYTRYSRCDDAVVPESEGFIDLQD